MLSEADRIEALEAAQKLVACLSENSESSRSESTRVLALRITNHVIRSLEKPEDGLMKFAYSVRYQLILRLSGSLIG